MTQEEHEAKMERLMAEYGKMSVEELKLEFDAELKLFPEQVTRTWAMPMEPGIGPGASSEAGGP
jgi:hypothetical protein